MVGVPAVLGIGTSFCTSAQGKVVEWWKPLRAATTSKALLPVGWRYRRWEPKKNLINFVSRQKVHMFWERTLSPGTFFLSYCFTCCTFYIQLPFILTIFCWFLFYDDKPACSCYSCQQTIPRWYRIEIACRLSLLQNEHSQHCGMVRLKRLPPRRRHKVQSCSITNWEANWVPTLFPPVVLMPERNMTAN